MSYPVPAAAPGAPEDAVMSMRSDCGVQSSWKRSRSPVSSTRRKASHKCIIYVYSKNIEQSHTLIVGVDSTSTTTASCAFAETEPRTFRRNIRAFLSCLDFQ